MGRRRNTRIQSREQRQPRRPLPLLAGAFPHPLALTVFVVLAAGTAFGLYQFNGQSQPTTEARISREPAISPVALSAAPAGQNFIIKTFDPSVWPRSDREIGVEGFVIEDFEDRELVDGLQIELSDSTSENLGPTETLPMVFNPDINDSGGARVFVAGIWDGSRVLINRRNPPPHGYADYVWSDA